ncbi:MAG: polymer-forming cytoskeletal protein [Hyphomonas sp.]
MAADKSREAAAAPAGAGELNVISAGCRIEGEMSFPGSLRLGGQVRGDVRCEGTLTIEVGGILEGTIRAGEIIVHGSALGEVIAVRRLEVSPGGRVEGSIYAPSMKVEGNARIDGDVLIAPERTPSHAERARTLPAVRAATAKPAETAAPLPAAVSNGS